MDAEYMVNTRAYGTRHKYDNKLEYARVIST